MNCSGANLWFPVRALLLALLVSALPGRGATVPPGDAQKSGVGKAQEFESLGPGTPPRVPLGHRDFYPSSERPVGLRGDGSGAWPGATPVTEWNASNGKNIAWKTAMPGPSFSQPIVVGDKVFTLADPNWLICLSAVDGKIL